MVIEHAERFGLSQLHQLRGRVGRSQDPSQCLLIAQYRRTEDAEQRLRVMEQTTDGFKIAEEDLAIRGPGELLGTQQSGLPDFRVANFVRDFHLLNEARKEAFAVIDRDPTPFEAGALFHEGNPHRKMERKTRTRSGGLISARVAPPQNPRRRIYLWNRL